MDDQSVRVRRYYEANTRWMLARGSGRGEGVIHRPVWLPGASRRRQAVRSVEALIRDRLAAAGALETPSPAAEAGGYQSRRLHLLDLGCGAGGTAVWLAERLPVAITGITLSAAQVREARELARRRGVQERCRFVEGDFLEAPTGHTPGADGGSVDAAYAIEAFSHASDPGVFLDQAARRLDCDGLLFLCDDFAAFPDGPGEGAGPCGKLPQGDPAASRRRDRWLEGFRRGWHLGPLPSDGEVTAAARRRGLERIERIDLSPYLRNHPVRARMGYALLGMLPGRGPWVSSRRGGAALQVCLGRHWVRYLFLVFQKRCAL